MSISQWARPGALVLSGCIFPVLLFDKLGLGVRSFNTILRKLNCWQARSALLSRVCVCVCVCGTVRVCELADVIRLRILTSRNPLTASPGPAARKATLFGCASCCLATPLRTASPGRPRVRRRYSVAHFAVSHPSYALPARARPA